MEIQLIAGFGPITRTPAEGVAFWSESFGIPLEEMAPDYDHARGLEGAKVFGLWPLHQAAEATFGAPDWPADRPVPQAWVELEVASPEAVGEAEAELRVAGHEVLVGAHTEPWGQTTARLQSPRGCSSGCRTCPPSTRRYAPDRCWSAPPARRA